MENEFAGATEWAGIALRTRDLNSTVG